MNTFTRPVFDHQIYHLDFASLTWRIPYLYFGLAGGTQTRRDIRIRMLNGDAFMVQAEGHWTFIDVKKQICAASGLPVQEQRLLIDGKDVF